MPALEKLRRHAPSRTWLVLPGRRKAGLSEVRYAPGVK